MPAVAAGSTEGEPASILRISSYLVLLLGANGIYVTCACDENLKRKATIWLIKRDGITMATLILEVPKDEMSDTM